MAVQLTNNNNLICSAQVSSIQQGRRKLLKVGGGQALIEGHFSNKKGHLNIFPRKCWRRGGEVISKKFSGHTKKIFRIYNIFFLNMKNFSQDK